MQLKVFSCVSWGLILALWNAFKPFSVTGLHPWPDTGEVLPDPFKSAYSIKYSRNAPNAVRMRGWVCAIVIPPLLYLSSGLKLFLSLSNSYTWCTMGCPHVRGDNSRALASGLSYVQLDKHGLTILYHLHQCRPCTSRDKAKSGKVV